MSQQLGWVLCELSLYIDQNATFSPSVTSSSIHRRPDKMSVSGLSLLPISAPPPSPFLHPLQPPLESCSIADASPPPGIICLNDRLVGKLDLCPIQYVVPLINLIKPTPLQPPNPSPPCGTAPHLHSPPPHHTHPRQSRPASTPNEPVQ